MSTTRTITTTYPDGTVRSYDSKAKAVKRFAVVVRDNEAKAAATRDDSIALAAQFLAEGHRTEAEAAQMVRFAEARFESDKAWGLLSEHGTREQASKNLAKWTPHFTELVIVEINDPAATAA